jgi:hypothetical protein
LTRPTQVRTPFSRTKDVRSFDDNWRKKEQARKKERTTERHRRSKQ